MAGDYLIAVTASSRCARTVAHFFAALRRLADAHPRLAAAEARTLRRRRPRTRGRGWRGRSSSCRSRRSRTSPASRRCPSRSTGTAKGCRSASTSPPASATRRRCFGWPPSSKRRAPGRTSARPSAPYSGQSSQRQSAQPHFGTAAFVHVAGRAEARPLSPRRLRVDTCRRIPRMPARRERARSRPAPPPSVAGNANRSARLSIVPP